MPFSIICRRWLSLIVDRYLRIKRCCLSVSSCKGKTYSLLLRQVRHLPSPKPQLLEAVVHDVLIDRSEAPGRVNLTNLLLLLVLLLSLLLLLLLLLQVL